jgi:lectin-like protein
MTSGRYFVLVAAALAAASACLPLEGDLDDYSRDWRADDPDGESQTDTDPLQGAPSATTPPSNEGTPDDGSSTPGMDGNPDDPTLSNPDQPVDTGSSGSGSSGNGSSGNETPPDETPTEEPPAEEEPLPPPPNPCPDGIANGPATTCYFVSTEALPWQDARTACRTWGGDLVMMDAPFEDAFVATLTTESVWIGGSDIASDNTYLWADGRPMPFGQFGNWAPAQPDSFPGQDCIEKREEQFERWYDRPCTAPFPYVCEKPAAQAPATAQ